MALLITLVGPTAVGKTALALALAKRYGTEIISSDARQLYRGLDIGTAKPTAAERAEVRHHFLDILDPDQPYSAGEFGREAEALLRQLFQQHEVVIVVGGSTLYVQALWFEFDEMPPVDPALREALNAQLEQAGLAPLLEELARVDPATFAQIDRQNPARVLRALELYRSSGTPASELRQGLRPKEVPWQTLKIGLEDERAALYARIDQRVEAMLVQGLEAEVRHLLERYPPEAPGLQSIGYREWLPYFADEIDRAEVCRLIQRNSRRYAKRQLTWYRRFDDLRWFQPGAEEAIGRLCDERLGDGR